MGGCLPFSLLYPHCLAQCPTQGINLINIFSIMKLIEVIRGHQENTMNSYITQMREKDLWRTSLGLVSFDRVCLQRNLYVSNFIVKLTLPCPYALSTHFYATGNLLGTPKTQHLRAFFLALEHTQLLPEVPPRAVTSRSWWINTSPFFLHS